MAGADNQKTPSSTSGGGNDNNNNKLYKGVRKRKWGKWVSEIRLPNSRERIWLGSYDSPEKAARAFDAALYCLRGRRASFNFPDTPFNLDINVAVAGDQSLTPHEIQELAAKFANNNKDQEDPPLALVVDNNSSSNDNHQESLIDQQLQRPSGNSNSINSTRSHIGTESSYTTASSSTNMYECDGSRVQQVDQHGDMTTFDWTFLNVLDDSSNSTPFAIGSGDPYSLYSHGLDQMHSGELLYSTPPPPTFEADFNGDEIQGDDPFSHQSFLWNWNF